MAAADGPHSIAFGDFNGDGRIDMGDSQLPPPGKKNVSILLVTGAGRSARHSDSDRGQAVRGRGVEDLNADGKLDLAIANNGAQRSVLLGNGDGTFGARADYGAGDLHHLRRHPDSTAERNVRRSDWRS